MPEKVFAQRSGVVKLQRDKGAGAYRRLPFGRLNDTSEREADRAADRVMAAGRSVAGVGPVADIKPLAARGDASIGGRMLAQVFNARSGGKPLEQAGRALMEQRLGYDFGRVRVHTDSFAARACGGIGAQALTAGSNIFFGPGRYRPDTNRGMRLMAHELSHVVQQQSAPALQAYGYNVHYEHTKTWAEDVFGPGSREAETIALADHGMDEGWTHPHFATPTEFVYSSDDGFTHFPSRSAALADIEQAIRSADPATFGRALHRYQDTYSHSFPAGEPLSDLSHSRDGATGWARDALLELSSYYSNTGYGRGAAIWHSLLGYYPDDFKVNSEQGTRDDSMEKDTKRFMTMFYFTWRLIRMMGTPTPPGLTVMGTIFGPSHVGPYMRR